MIHSVELQCEPAYKYLLNRLVAGSEISVDRLIRMQAYHLAKSNQLLLALLRCSSPLDDLPETFQNWITKLERLEQETADVVQHILPRFSAEHLPFLAIKSFLPFPYVDTNLDLVTARPTKVSKYVSLLKRLGYRRRWNLADLREPMKEIYGTATRVLTLHVHTAISWNGVIYLPLSQVWERRRLLKMVAGTVWVPSPEDELLIMAAHALFENKTVSMHELLYLRRLILEDLDWDYISKIVTDCGWRYGFLRFMATVNELNALVEIPLQLPFPLPSVRLAPKVWLPYVIPFAHSLGITIRKLSFDVKNHRWRWLPRQLFSYTLVDGVWMYRKAYRKQREVKKICL